MEDLDTGKLDSRLEAAITAPLDKALNEVARELAGARSPRMFRSKAARMLLIKGIKAHRAEQARKTAAKA